MSNRQIQPVRPRDYQLARQVRPRSLWGQLWTITLQPGYFFHTLPSPGDSRQWVWVAILILSLVGLSAVRQEAIQNAGTGSNSSPIDFNSPPGTDLGGGNPFSSNPNPITIPSGVVPGDSDGGSSSTSPDDISATLTTALIAASYILLGWFILAVLLSEIPLFNGQRPSFSQNLQIAIWTTVPMGVMAGIQVVYYAAGGGVGQPGLSGLLSAWKPYETFSAFPKSIVLSLAIRATLFWLWSLLLIYRGGRSALNGRRWSVMIVVAAWTLILVIVPVVTGSISAEPAADTVSDTSNSSDLPFGNTGLVDPFATSSSTDLGTLPPELQFLVQPSGATPEATTDFNDEPTPATDQIITPTPGK
jgi:hypothetical protein